jgi:glutathione S-transferase
MACCKSNDLIHAGIEECAGKGVNTLLREAQGHRFDARIVARGTYRDRQSPGVGGVSLDPYGHVRAWLARIEVLPGFVAMRRSTPPELV